jgi:hypothetical protein
MAENELPSILNYWRNCLADAARMNVKPERFKEAFKIPKSEVESGRINSAQVEKIFAAYLKSKKHGQQQQKVSLKAEDNLPIKVLVCPVAAFPKPVSTIKMAGKDKPITPIWIPAALFKDGILCPANEDKPWIPRNLLEPIELSGDTIGDVEAVDKFLALNSSPVNKEDKGQAPRWADVWRYSDELLNSVAQRTIKGFDIDGYIVANCSYVLLDLQDEKRIPAYHIIRLYEHILWDLENNKAFTAPRLLQRYANLHDEPLTPLLSPRAEVEKSSEHLGQMSRQDSKGREIFLSKSQREAMHHTLTMKDGEILAINGPPGTGKTTLLQSVVATLWIEAAANGKGEPPIIVAASTNNQAVTNVIDSFGKVIEDESKLAGRWIPDLTSYGLYCPSILKQATATGFQITDQQKGGFCLALTPEQARDKAERRNIETEEFVDSAESYFLERCGDYAERRIDDVDAATKLLHERLIEVVDAIKRGPQIWLNLKRLADEMSSLYDNAGGVETCIHKRTEHLKEIRAKSRRLEETQHGWLEHANAAPFWMSLLSFIPPIKQRIAVHNKLSVDAICDAGLGASDGNVMKIAQRASKYQKSDERGKFERGMFLAEHRRCVPEIIEYCNRLAYKGRLIAARPSEPGYPLPRLGYAHISGESTKEGGGSRVNAIEADVIAQWIAEHQEMLKSKLYPNLPLKEIIAVVTPFKRQTRLLEEKLANQGVTDDIDVGTVHVLQGAERHIILFSPVYGANDSPPYFFDDGVNMLNVAVSRAKDSFLVFGDMNSFNTNATEPSGILGRFLFADESNEITDVKLPVREKAPLSRIHPHLDTLEAHRTALTESIRNARRAVWIVSPFIAEAAIVADKLPAIIREAVNRGVKVTVYTDQKLNLNRDGSPKYSFTKGERALLNSGAIVKHVRSDHSKTLMMDHDWLIEGSFNWLSASRDLQSDYQRRERSLRYSGKDVESIIEKIIEETESRVIVRGTMYT